MKQKFLLFCFLLVQIFVCFSQENHMHYPTSFSCEDKNGNIIIDPIEKEKYYQKRLKEFEQYASQNKVSKVNQVAVPLCSNGGFEEYVNNNGDIVLKNFQYAIVTPLNPIQCKSATENASFGIKQYNPNDMNAMATTVPSNHLDDYIGNINGFDQYSLKLNYADSPTLMTLVQAKRFKTDNETVLKFNYKVVLQSIPENGHLNEQPYFKARVLNAGGAVVSEFCLTADVENCIYTQAPVLAGSNIILYTKNWQSGNLDISSIPNNEDFTVEFMTTRCGLYGHFGYSYIDDICVSHSDENLQGNVELENLYVSCPTAPVSICGSFTVPNSGNIKADVKSIELKVYDSSNKLIHTTSNTKTLDLVKKTFCFELDLTVFPDTKKESYNVSVAINYDIDRTTTACAGTSFNEVKDDDANPGWDITFLNCDPKCTLKLTPASLSLCDDDKNGKEIFNLTNLEPLVTVNQTGVKFSYFTKLDEAMTDKNAITNFINYDSYSSTLFVRATLDVDCYKIIAVKLIVRNPAASINGILNVCGGSTTLTATKGVSYLWSGGEKTQNIQATTTGLYSVTVTDALGCKSVGEVTILPSTIAAQPTINITQPDCFKPTGSIEVTSAALQYSFDGGASWGNNSILKDVPIGSYDVKIRTVNGCESYNTKINLIPYLSNFPQYNKIDPKSCGDFGSITITTKADFYSFDDGVTWETNNNKANLASGDYRIRIKDSFGCISNYNSVQLNSEFLPKAEYLISNPYCSNLGGITITTPGTSFSFDGGTIWQTSNSITGLTAGSYIIKIRNNLGCTSVNEYVYLNNLENIYPEFKLTQAGCNTYASIEIKTLGDLYSFDNGLNWSSNPILENLDGGTSYQLLVQKGGTCKSETQYLNIYSYFRPLPAATDFEPILCDNLNDGVEIIDLTNHNSNLIPNDASYKFEYFKTRLGATNSDRSQFISNFKYVQLSNINNEVFVKVISQYGCVSVVRLKFKFIDSPRIKMQDKYPLCEFKSVDIDAGSGFNSYLWSNGEKTQIINLVAPGDYWVNVTEKHGSLICDSTKKFNVFLSNPAIITSITTKDWSETENVISIFQTGLGDYEYSLDNKTYQDNNTFTDLLNGEYTVYVRDKFNCGTTTQDVYLLMYSRFFTPNGDGYNDTWRIKLSNFEAGLAIKIFDRNGKLIKTLTNMDNGWDGTYGGQALPASDYWFLINRANGLEHKGHFSLKR